MLSTAHLKDIFQSLFPVVLYTKALRSWMFILVLVFLNNVAIMLSLNYRFAFARHKILSALNDFLKSSLMSSGVQYIGSCEHHMYQRVAIKIHFLN